MSRDIASVFTLEESLEKKIAADDLDAALRLVEKSVEQIINEPLCTARITGDARLDSHCQKIGSLTLQSLPQNTVQLAAKTRVYIATKLQKSGGHTRVLADLVRAAPKDLHHIVLSTELLGSSDRTEVEESLKGYDIVFEWSKGSSRLEKLLWLQRRLRNIAPASVWLFNHHQDASAIAAIQPGQGYEIYFYHHGDHHLTLGLFLPGATHIDPLPVVYHNCHKSHDLTRNVYLPLWMKDIGSRSATSRFMHGAVTTCMAANANKIEVPYFISYPAMIPEIIKATGGRHIHIGKLTPWTLWKIKRSLSTHQIEASRFIYIPWVPSVWQAMHEYSVDLYIASFPYSGARTMIEVMGSGTPLCVHDHCETRLLSSVDLAYPEAFTWRDPRDLYAFLKNLTPKYLESQSRAARASFLAHHNAEMFQNIDVSKLGSISVPSLRSYTPDHLQESLNATRQFTLFGLVWRFLSRHRRILKKFLGDFI